MSTESKSSAAGIVLGAFVLIVYASFLVFATFYWKDGWILTLFKDHYVFFVGLPFAGFVAYFIVTTLESTRGRIEFELASVKFKGASGPIVMWILVFLAITMSFAVAWPLK